MAVCDFCKNNESSRVIDGNNFCERCFGNLQALRDGNPDAIEYFSNPDSYKVATHKIQSYMMKVAYNAKEKAEEKREQKEEQPIVDKTLSELKKREALKNMLITSGFNFDGYKVVKYSGYISGDDVVQIERGVSLIGSLGTTDTGSALTNSLVKIRRRALQELKEAAYNLGCNAVIGVDFDYITLEPETASLAGGTKYLPYVFCVTANGNAVIIEKDNQKQSVASILKEYKELLDCEAISQEEFDAKKRELL